MAKFPFIGPSYTSQSLNVECEKTVNFYPERVETGLGKNIWAMYPTPGTAEFCELAGVSVRGFASINSRVFAVSGDTFYELFSDGTFTARGTVAVDTLPASISASQNQLVIISGGVAYYFTLATNTFAAIVGMLGTPIQTVFMDGYFLVLLADSKQFQISGLLDATTWNGLETAIISVFSDNVESMIVCFRDLWFHGKKASQIYFDSGNADFPFQIIQQGYIEQGAVGPWTTVKIGESVYWIGASDRGNAVAYRAQGPNPQRISNHAVEYHWQQYSTVADAIAYAYEDQGHQFWVIYFPTADATWVYDVAINEWHERGFWLPASNRYEAHHSRCHIFAFGKHLVGDWQSGKVYEMSIDILDDDGSPLRRLRRAPHISNEQKFMYYSQIQIDFEAGLGDGNPASQGFNPQAILRWSDDGGKTWSNDYLVETGKIGEYKKRAIWRRLGRSRDRVFELSVSDPIPWRIAAAYIEASAGTGN